MDVRRILKVYKYVNDEKRPKVNVKFLAALGAFLLSGMALIGFFTLEKPGSANPGATAAGAGGDAREAREGGRSIMEYVGLEPDELAQAQLDPTLAERRLAQWKADLPRSAVIEKEERVEANVGGETVTVGWRVTYHLA